MDYSRQKRHLKFFKLWVMLAVTGCAAGGGYAVATGARETDRMRDGSTITSRIHAAMVKDDLAKGARR